MARIRPFKRAQKHGLYLQRHGGFNRGEPLKDLDQVTALFTRIERLSTAQLHQAAENLVQEEKVCVATLIAHLSEISRRKTHLDLGYGSLWDYCMRHLGLSEGSTGLRIQVARVSRLFPQI